jgi:hypothetical protein
MGRLKVSWGISEVQTMLANIELVLFFIPLRLHCFSIVP